MSESVHVDCETIQRERERERFPFLNEPDVELVYIYVHTQNWDKKNTGT